MTDSVRGAFEIDTLAARRNSRELRQEVDRLDRAAARAGKSLDKIGTPRQQAQVRAYRREIESLGRTSTKVSTTIDQNWRRTTRTIERETLQQSAHIDRLDRRMTEFSRKRVTPTVEIKGITAAILQVQLLKRELASLDRSRPSPNIGLGSTLIRGAGGAVPGGGGGSGAFLGSGGVGVFTSRSRLIAGAALSALSPVQTLATSATALLGTFAGAGLGVGAAGVAGGGALAAGIGSIAAVAIPAIKNLGQLKKVQDQYNQTVALYGKNSKQAALAQEKLNVAESKAPRGASRVLSSLTRLQSTWNRRSRRAQGNFLATLSGGLGTARALTSTVGPVATQTTGALRREAGNFGGFLRQGQQRNYLRAGGSIFSQNLGSLEGTLEGGSQTLGNIMIAARPFFREGTTFIEHWAKGWATSTNNVERTRSRVAAMIDQAKSVGRFGGAGGRLIADILKAGSGPGQGLLDSATRKLEQWDRWIKTNPTRVKQFFDSSVKSTKDLASAAGQLVKAMVSLSNLMTPIVNRFSQLVTLAGQAGLLTPGVGVAALGAFRGFTGRQGGGGGLLGAAFGGVGERSGPGLVARSRAAYGSAAEGTRISNGLSWMTGAALASPRGAGVRAGAKVFGGAARAGLGAAGKAYLPIGALLAGLDASSFNGGTGDKLQAGLSSFTLGLVPRPLDRSQISDKASQGVSALIAKLDPRGTGAGLARLQASQKSIAGLTGLPGETGSTAKAMLTILKQEIDARRALVKQMRDERSQRHAQSIGADIRKGYRILAPRVGKEQAFQTSVGTALGKIGNMRDAGAMPLAQDTLTWAKRQAKANPELLGQVRVLERGIKERFSNISKHVQIVNGNILTGTKKEWGGIQRAISSAAEQAREDTQASFTAIQRQAVGSLVAMGFSRGQATRLVQGMENGGGQGKLAKDIANAGPGGANFLGHDLTQGVGGKKGRNKARGGRLPGRGRMDTVPMSDGGYGAPGELTTNQHTERRVNGMLAAFGTSLGAEVAREKHKHSDAPVANLMRATGGRTGNGLQPGISQLANTLVKRFGLSITSTTGGQHAAGSYHYRGLAADLGGPTGTMNRAAAWLGRSSYASRLAEGIHNPNLSIKGGHRVPPSFWGATTWANHANHIHVAMTGGPMNNAPTSRFKDSGGASMSIAPLRAPVSRQGGAPGAMVNRAGQVYAAGLTSRINSTLGGGGGVGVRGGGRIWGASVFGGPNDPGTGHIGYRGDDLNKHPNSFAELGMGHAMGGLPYLAKVRVTGPRGSAIAYKRDIGLGGGDVGGRTRGIDLWYKLAEQIGVNGTAPVKVQRLRARGGRVAPAWAGWHGDGGQFTANGPTLFGVGERGKEHVNITPGGRSRGGDIHVNVTMGEVHMHGKEDAKSIMEEAAQLAAVEIRKALNRSEEVGALA